jgi:2-polyprenyl-6-methoxyphenol hydroxylase-like FAD-dependent oxidoreductase
MMSALKNAEVLVVGAGPVGLTTALRLVQHGIRVEIIDQDWRTAAHSYACALHPKSLEVLDQLSLRSTIESCGLPVDTIGVCDSGGRRMRLDLSESPTRYPYLVVLRQDMLERVLETQLESIGVKVHWNHRLAAIEQHEDEVCATIDRIGKSSGGYAVSTTDWSVERTREVRAKFVIGADGHESTVRGLLGIDFQQIAEPMQFAVFEFSGDNTAGRELDLVLSDEGLSVLWPLPDNHRRWGFEVRDIEVPRRTREKSRLPVQLGTWESGALDKARLSELLESRAAWYQDPIGRIFWAMLVRFERRLAASFGEQRVWLVGDAAHTTAPVGVQSMNVGLREASDLVRHISQILRRNAQLESLSEYQCQRRSEWSELVGLNGEPDACDGADPWIASHAQSLRSSLPATGGELRFLLGRLGLSLPSTPSAHVL